MIIQQEVNFLAKNKLGQKFQKITHKTFLDNKMKKQAKKFNKIIKEVQQEIDNSNFNLM